MSKELRELLAKLGNLEAQAQTILAKEGATANEIRAKTDEIKTVKAKIEYQKTVDEGKEFDPNGVEITGTVAKQQKEDKAEAAARYKKAFLAAFRRKATSEDRKVLAALSPWTDSDGGLLVPSDTQTAINIYKRELSELEPLINVLPVNNSSGTRVFETVATMTAFTNITDLTDDIEDMGSPAFENISYSIKDYAGYMPIPNDLLDDSDQNILDYLANWIARKSVVTRNTLILGILKELTCTTFTDYTDIKKALNVTLDPMLAPGAMVVTNQDGFQYLDTLEDAYGRPILQVDVTKPTQKLFAGKPVKIMSNSVLSTSGTDTLLAPIFVGNLKEAITMFERRGHQIASTNVGGTAFRKNRTEIRVIEREDVVQIDSDAVVYGNIDVTSALS
jgi:HK97 family phage major capsid protein